MASYYITCVSVLTTKKWTGLWFMFLNVCVDIFESNYRHDALYSRVSNPQAASTLTQWSGAWFDFELEQDWESLATAA